MLFFAVCVEVQIEKSAIKRYLFDLFCDICFIIARALLPHRFMFEVYRYSSAIFFKEVNSREIM